MGRLATKITGMESLVPALHINVLACTGQESASIQIFIFNCIKVGNSGNKKGTVSLDG